jgi:catechol 2,3-dioxygenase-like lactoylglutathione lyase family enzyme
MTDDRASTTADPSDPEVAARPPESAFHTVGTDHVTLIGSNVAETVAFYRDLLGMALVLRQPNLDQPEVTHLFFDTGDGRMLTFFVEEGRNSHRGPQRPGVGAVHHLAFRIDPDRFAAVERNLADAGHRYDVFDRGVFHSIYTTDHNGLVIELATDKWAIPDDRRGEVLALAHTKRVDAGAEYAGEEHVEAALEELGLGVERYDLPDSATGTGV